MADNAPKKQFNQGLEVVRGIAALDVVMAHCLLCVRLGGLDPLLLPTDASGPWHVLVQLLVFLCNGSASVTLFFVLSGTVLALSLSHDEPLKGRTIIGYWLKRFFRLYPLVSMAAVLGALCQITILQPTTFPGATSWVNTTYQFPIGSVPSELIKNILAVSSSLNAAAWSMKVEVMGSLVFPIIYLLSRGKWSARAALVVFVGLMFVFQDSRSAAYMNVFGVCFLAGAMIPRWGKPIAAWFQNRGRVSRTTILLVAVVCLLGARPVIDAPTFVPPVPVLLETIAAGFIVAVVYFGSGKAAIFHYKPARWIGEISFSIYLLHVPIIFVLVHLSYAAALPIAVGGGVPFLLFLIASTIALTLPLATLSHRFIESPGQRLGRRLAGRFETKRQGITGAVSAGSIRA